LIRDPERRRAAASMCRDHVLGSFSEDQVVTRLRTVYREVSAA
jgi:hypothetical protein